MIVRSANNTIGGTTPAARNVISSNGGAGIAIVTEGSVPASGNLVQGNFIGTDATGTARLLLGNLDGIDIATSNNTIGGTVAGARQRHLGE